MGNDTSSVTSSVYREPTHGAPHSRLLRLPGIAMCNKANAESQVQSGLGLQRIDPCQLLVAQRARGLGNAAADPALEQLVDVRTRQETEALMLPDQRRVFYHPVLQFVGGRTAEQRVQIAHIPALLNIGKQLTQRVAQQSGVVGAGQHRRIPLPFRIDDLRVVGHLERQFRLLEGAVALGDDGGEQQEYETRCPTSTASNP